MTTFSSMESLPMFSFDKPGDVVDITIDEDAREVETKYGPRIVLSGPSGPESTAQVIADEARRAPERDERCSVFLRLNGSQGGAIAAALRTAGLPADTKSLGVGVRLRVKFASEAPSGKGNPTKLYQAKVEEAVVAANGDEWGTTSEPVPAAGKTAADLL